MPLRCKLHDSTRGRSPGRPGRRERVALLGMYEAVRVLRGSLDIVSRPGQGTRVALDLLASDVLKAPGPRLLRSVDPS